MFLGFDEFVIATITTRFIRRLFNRRNTCENKTTALALLTWKQLRLECVWLSEGITWQRLHPCITKSSFVWRPPGSNKPH